MLFIGNKTADYFVALLEEIRNLFNSLLFNCVHLLSNYLSALVSILYNKEELYKCFCVVLYSLCQNGMYVTKNSFIRLACIKRALDNKNMRNLFIPLRILCLSKSLLIVLKDV